MLLLVSGVAFLSLGHLVMDQQRVLVLSHLKLVEVTITLFKDQVERA